MEYAIYFLIGYSAGMTYFVYSVSRSVDITQDALLAIFEALEEARTKR